MVNLDVDDVGFEYAFGSEEEEQKGRPKGRRSDDFVFSTGGRLCLDSCVEGKCKTEPYKWFGREYDWDHC